MGGCVSIQEDVVAPAHTATPSTPQGSGKVAPAKSPPLQPSTPPHRPKKVTLSPSDSTGSDRLASSGSSGSAHGTSSVHQTGSADPHAGSAVRAFSFRELNSATRGFREDAKLGEGGFGGVFRGVLSDGRQIAVKKLNAEGTQGDREWTTEVRFLGQLSHPNLVHLIGYCSEGEHRELVYEFLPNGSLDNWLFSRSRKAVPWDTRMKIALDAARGLAYLHEEVNGGIIFRDLKSSNVLLDENFNAKLSDFGLAKDGPQGNKSHVSTRVMGTQGYAAPEYVFTGHLTIKSDVYTFGVVLLEIVCGRRALDSSRPRAEQSLVEWARPQLGDRQTIPRIVDPRLSSHYSHKALRRAAVLAMHCLRKEAHLRPTMSNVARALESIQGLHAAEQSR